MHCLVFTDTDLYSLTKGKSYLAKQKWRRSTCLRDQCYDVGCHPCMYIFSKIQLFEVQPCADPESYVRGGPTSTLTFFS